ncbi:hypothetical protein Tco_0887052, partial [Tanacetum coccineum]
NLRLVFGMHIPAYRESSNLLEKNKADIEHFAFGVNTGSCRMWSGFLFGCAVSLKSSLFAVFFGAFEVVSDPSFESLDMVCFRLLLVFCQRLFVSESLVEGVLLDERVVGLAMVVEMPETQRRATYVTMDDRRCHLSVKSYSLVIVTKQHWCESIPAFEFHVVDDRKQGTELKKKLRENGFHENLVAFLDWESDDEYNYYAYEEVGATLAENTRANLQ